MSYEILKCKSCGSYGLEKQCGECSDTRVSPKPGKYSPEDKYGKYRRIYRRSH